jgi:AraC-like DNA-binding protein
MYADPTVKHSQSLEQWCALALPGDRLLSVANGEQPLRLGHRDTAREWWLPPGWQGVLVARAGMQWFEGQALVRSLAHAPLLKLQFFIDQAFAPPADVPAEPLAALAAEFGERALEEPALEQWYLAQALAQGEGHEQFAQALRSTESYQLIRFLNDNAVSSGKLQDLAQRYGVSVSHFRRLCRHALGGTVKTGMRQWRTARALLAIADGCPSLTDVALQLGYASSSHFSKEFKELVGVVPSRLIDPTRLPC